jgi:hypothetical protein
MLVHTVIPMSKEIGYKSLPTFSLSLSRSLSLSLRPLGYHARVKEKWCDPSYSVHSSNTSITDVVNHTPIT